MAKRLLVLLVGGLGFFIFWAVTDLDYDHTDPYSIERMMKWSPAKASMLIQDMSIAANGPYAKNLTGLNASQIHKLAEQRRKEHNSKQLELIQRRNMGYDKPQ